MVRCRSVSDESTECNRPSAAPDEVLLLSLMALNVAAAGPEIKHVFDWRVEIYLTRHGPAVEPPNDNGVTLRSRGYSPTMSVVATDELVGGVV